MYRLILLSPLLIASFAVSQNPLSAASHKKYTLLAGGGMGALVAPDWIITASHCITSRHATAKNIPIHFINKNGRKIRVRGTHVFRYTHSDIALVKLASPLSPEQRTPAYLLSQPILKQHGTVKIDKAIVSTTYKGIPARVGRVKDRLYISTPDRKGKAGTSGSPWIIRTKDDKDVIVAVTHGSGRGPQIGSCAKWITETIRENGNAPLQWVKLSELPLKKTQ